MKKATCVCAFLIAAFALAAQKTGAVEYKELGLAFSIPQGWVGQETDEGFLMGHNTEPGFILLLPHEYNSLENLRQEAAEGIEDEGVSLQLKNKRLSYIYSSSSRTGGYTGMSETEEMWLCAAGYFQYKSSSHNSFDSGGAFGHSSGKENGAGTWNVVLNNNGGPMLQLTFQNGQVKNYNINGIQNGKLNLGGYKYFYSNAGDVCK